MNFRVLFLASVLVLVINLCAFANPTPMPTPPLNKFEGHVVVVNASPTGGGPAVNYNTTAPVTVTSSPPSPLPTIYDCKTGVQITNAQVPVSVTTGYFCFLGAEVDYGVAYGGGNTWAHWFANSRASGFYNVVDFGAEGHDDADDTAAIKNAVAFIAAHKGGTLYFPEGTYIVGESSDHDPITLPSGIVIQGATGMSPRFTTNYQPGTRNTQIVTKSAGRTIFRIGESSSDIMIRDIALAANPNTVGTVGLDAVGTYGTNTQAVMVGLDNVTFSDFGIGFYAHSEGGSSDSWQFDHIKVDHCYFLYNKAAGIKVNTYNTDWRIASSQFLVAGVDEASGGLPPDGISVLKGGMFLVENSFGGGQNNGVHDVSGAFLNIETIGSLTVINSESEGMSNSLVFGNGSGSSGGNSALLTLINNIFGNPVLLRARATFISTSNLYAGQTVQTVAGVKVYSTGDRFCYDATSGLFEDPANPGIFRWPCGEVGPTQSTAKAGFQGPGKIMFETGQQRDSAGSGGPGDPVRVVEGRPMRIGSDVLVNADDDYPGNTGLTILSGNNSKPLLSLGETGGNTYNLRRNANGYLSFAGTEAFPNRGYVFDAPLAPPSFDWLNLPTGPPPNGSTVYCTNCARNSVPCAIGGTGGAPATNINGVWECK